MIEDEPINLDMLHKHCVPIVIFDATYNKDYDKPHHRMLSWEKCCLQLQHMQ